MKKAVIIYQSKTGITKKFGEQIRDYLVGKGIDAQEFSVKEYRDGLTDQADLVLLGCWTSGLMLLFQHPDKKWKEFSKRLTALDGKKTGLFTTYKIATGSMFRNMRKFLQAKDIHPSIELKSKNGSLSEENRAILDQFVKD
jgi:flavodoxin